MSHHAAVVTARVNYISRLYTKLNNKKPGNTNNEITAGASADPENLPWRPLK